MKDTFSDYIYNILEMHVDLNLDDYENLTIKLKKYQDTLHSNEDEGSVRYYLYTEITDLMMLTLQDRILCSFQIFTWFRFLWLCFDT